MVKSRLTPMPLFTTIGRPEQDNIIKSLKKPLSGYLGGVDGAGYWVERLSAEWGDAFGVPHVIPCNSATSGLLAACMAAGIGPGDEVWVSAYTMSATAAAPKILGAKVEFVDITDDTYTFGDDRIGWDWENDKPKSYPQNLKAIIVTNLFGHPAHLIMLRRWCDSHGVLMIEDNAQAPFAMEGNKYAGTIGHIGVFSLNVHKHIQCGEGGVVVTAVQHLAEGIKQAINHGELASGRTGLNLRMAEPIAAIACAQLAKAEKVIQTRIDLAHEINYMFRHTPVDVPVERPDCRHVFYMWAGRVKQNRDKFIKALNDRGVPFRAGYIRPLHQLFNAGYGLPVAEKVETEIITFEVCAYDPNLHHLKSMDKIIQEEAHELYDEA